MTTTTNTTGRHQTSRLAALAAGTALVVGSTVGLAWAQDNSAPAGSQAHPGLHSYTRWFYWVAPATPAPAASSSGVATADDEFVGVTHPYPRGWSTPGPTG